MGLVIDPDLMRAAGKPFRVGVEKFFYSEPLQFSILHTNTDQNDSMGRFLKPVDKFTEIFFYAKAICSSAK